MRLIKIIKDKIFNFKIFMMLEKNKIKHNFIIYDMYINKIK